MTRASSMRIGPLAIACAATAAIACTSTEPTPDPAPFLDSIAPRTVAPAEQPVTATAYGRGFSRRSVVRIDGEGLATHFTSDTRLAFTLREKDFLTTGTLSARVFTPEPGGGESGVAPIQIVNARPVLAAVSPLVVLAGTDSVQLTIDGHLFTPKSRVVWNSSGATTTFVSSTQLTALVPGFFYDAAGVGNVTVINPFPGGGASDALTVAVENGVPSLGAASPASAPTSIDSLLVTLAGSGFVSPSIVRARGTDRPTTFVDAHTLRARLSDVDFDDAGPLPLTVVNPPPGGGTSTALALTVTQAPPRIVRVAPSVLPAGGAATDLVIDGRGFSSQATVRVDGAPIPTRFESNRRIGATLPAALLANTAIRQLVVDDPSRGGSSTPTQLLIAPAMPTLASMRFVETWVNDIAVHPHLDIIYATTFVPGNEFAGGLEAIDATTGQDLWTLDLGRGAKRLSVSDDGRYAYVQAAFDSLVLRVDLETRQIVREIVAGPSFRGALEQLSSLVLPGSPLSVIVVGFGPARMRVFDDAAPRPVAAPFGAPLAVVNGTHLVAFVDGAVRRYLITSRGLEPEPAAGTVPANGVFTSGGFDARGSYLVSSSGLVSDIAAMRVVRQEDLGGIPCVDPDNDRVHYLTALRLRTRQLTSGAAVSELPIPLLFGSETKCVRWGRDGLAFRRPNGIVIVRGSAVAP